MFSILLSHTRFKALSKEKYLTPSRITTNCFSERNIKKTICDQFESCNDGDIQKGCSYFRFLIRPVDFPRFSLFCYFSSNFYSISGQLNSLELKSTETEPIIMVFSLHFKGKKAFSFYVIEKGKKTGSTE